MMKKAFLLLMALVVLGVAFAEPTKVYDVNVISSSSWEATPVDDNVDVNAGTIYNVDLNMLSQTDKWAGLYGDITSIVVLADSSANKMFQWNVSNMTGWIYATQSTNPNWSNVATVDVEDASVDSVWGFSTTAPDNAENTYEDDNNPAMTVAGTAISAGTRDAFKPYTSNAETTNDNWWNVLLAHDSALDTKDDFIFAAKISQDQTAYNGNNADYQLMVPVGGTTETYYLYIELQ